MGLCLCARIYICPLIFFETHIAQAGLKFMIFLPQPPEFYDCEHTRSSLALKIKFHLFVSSYPLRAPF